MARKQITYAGMVLFLLVAGTSFSALRMDSRHALHGQEKSGQPLKRFQELHELHVKWNEGLFGSKKYYRNRLEEYCRNLVTREVQTDYSFILLSPEGVVDKKVQCRFRFGGWLRIYGNLDVDSVYAVTGKKGDMLKKWWRTNVLVSVKGKVRKYRLSRDRYGGVIELYFHNVKMVHQETGKTKKD